MSKSDLELMKQIAEFAKSHNSNTLIASSQLPQFVLDIPTPPGITLAADVRSRSNYELVGEVDALKLVDLDKEGLGAYKNYFSQ